MEKARQSNQDVEHTVGLRFWVMTGALEDLEFWGQEMQLDVYLVRAWVPIISQKQMDDQLTLLS